MCGGQGAHRSEWLLAAGPADRVEDSPYPTVRPFCAFIWGCRHAQRVIVILHNRGGENGRRAKTGSHSASWLRVLEFQNAAQCRRDGAVHGTAKHPEDPATLQGRLGLHPRSARDLFDALVALKFLGPQWAVLRYPQHGFLSRQTQAILYRRCSGDGQSSSLSSGTISLRHCKLDFPRTRLRREAPTRSKPCTPNQPG